MEGLNERHPILNHVVFVLFYFINHLLSTNIVHSTNLDRMFKGTIDI